MSRTLVDSGIDWIGKIPSNWYVCKVKNKYNYHKLIARDDSEKYDRIALTLNGVIKRDKEDANGLQPENYDSYQIVYENDLIFKLIDLENINTSRIGKSSYKGITSPAYIVLTPKEDNNYGTYYYLNMWYQEIFNNLGGNGVRSAINKDTLLNVAYLDIPLEEQIRIANYLDDKCSKIDRIIEDNNKEIELLEEYRQSKINECLIPKNNWRKVRIKNIVELHGRIGWQGLKASEFIDEGPYLVTGTDFIKGKVNWETCYHISEERYEEAKDIKLKENDLLITKDGTVGKLAYIERLPNKASLNSHLLLLRPINNVCSNKYLYWQLQTSHFVKYYKLESSGTIMESLTQESFSNYSFFVPEIQEQERIVNGLRNFCNKIDKVIEYRRKIIEKLEEYKKSLIYEVVTGKKEV